MISRLHFSALVISICVCSACSRTVSLQESERSDSALPFYNADKTPIIVLSRVLKNSEVGRPYQSKWYPQFKVQLYKVTIAVENILKGEQISNRLDVYYIADVGPSGGPLRLGMHRNGGRWHIGDRELFFLRHDSGVLRTICDFMSFCVVPVMTGAHPGFQPDLHKPISYAIVDLLLTKGQGISDAEMAQAIYKTPADGFSRDYMLQKLRQLALDKSPEIRNAACQILTISRLPCPT